MTAPAEWSKRPFVVVIAAAIALVASIFALCPAHAYAVTNARNLAGCTRTHKVEPGSYVLEKGELRFVEGLEVEGHVDLYIGDAQLVVEGKGIHVGPDASLYVHYLDGCYGKGRIFGNGTERLFDVEGKLELNGCVVGGSEQLDETKYGVYLHGKMSDMTINSGKIVGCTTCGVWSTEGGTIGLYGGDITGNEFGLCSCSTNQYGGPIPSGYVFVSGAPSVEGNTTHNLMLGDNEQLILNDQLRPGCRLALEIGGSQPVTTHYRTYMGDADPNSYFINGFGDNDSFALNEKGEVVKVRG